MQNVSSEKNLARTISIGAFVTTIAVSSWWSSEPVNYIKMLTLSVTAFALLLSFIIPNTKKLLTDSKLLFSLVILFVVQSFLSSLMSADNFSQNFYGVYGRNTGFLSYLCLGILFLSSSQVKSVESHKKILKFLSLAGLVNCVYCLSVMLGFDPIPWANNFGAPLGTFGNPNFIGAFLGFIFVLCFIYSIQNGISVKIRFAGITACIVLFYAILGTRALQGVVVSVIGVTFVVWQYLRTSKFSKWVERSFLLGTSLLGIFSILGVLQIGPLTSILYKSSISLRGIYWKAGIETGLSNLWFGAGMDSFGSWFRRSRDLKKLGPDTATNAAHNVFIDMFASGGLVLGLVYFSLVLFVLVRLMKYIKNSRRFDPIFVSVSTVWVCYQTQSLISINQIGLAIWGWILGGLVIAYTNFSTEKIEDGYTKKSLKKKRENVEVEGSTILLSLGGALLGLLIAFPPFLADANWRSSLASKDATRVEKALFQWPTDPIRLSSGFKVFLENQKNDKGYEIIKKATIEFPNDYYSWYNLGIMPNISPEERKEIDVQLMRLDPENTKRPW